MSSVRSRRIVGHSPASRSSMSAPPCSTRRRTVSTCPALAARLTGPMCVAWSSSRIVRRSTLANSGVSALALAFKNQARRSVSPLDALRRTAFSMRDSFVSSVWPSERHTCSRDSMQGEKSVKRARGVGVGVGADVDEERDGMAVGGVRCVCGRLLGVRRCGVSVSLSVPVPPPPPPSMLGVCRWRKDRKAWLFVIVASEPSNQHCS